MSWKRSLIEGVVWGATRVWRPRWRPVRQPRSIFVLRNNDLGDVLVVTPLFEALRRCFPEARIVAGVGSWAVPLLESNPHLSGVLPIEAPWHNHFVRGWGSVSALRYILSSQQVRKLAQQHFDIGIDVLGSPWGALLLVRSGIPHRMGVAGYAGGHSAMAQCVDYRKYAHVGRAALGFAELLGAVELPETRPQLYLREPELALAERRWSTLDVPNPQNTLRVVVGPGAGFPEKCWPVSYWGELVRLMSDEIRCSMVVVGGVEDRAAGAQLAAAHPLVRDWTGRTSLRESCALVAGADLVMCNSSVLMHVGAACRKPTLVLLGNCFESARLHSAQWGHGAGTLILGKDPGRGRIYTPIEVFAAIEEAFRLRLAV